MRQWIVVIGCTLVCAASAHAQAPGRSVFEGKGNCWTCHAKNAKGTQLGPDLTDGEWLNIDGSLDSIRAIVQRGVPKPRKHPAAMPAMGGAKLSPAEVYAVAAYVHGLRATAPDTAATRKAPRLAKRRDPQSAATRKAPRPAPRR